MTRAAMTDFMMFSSKRLIEPQERHATAPARTSAHASNQALTRLSDNRSRGMIRRFCGKAIDQEIVDGRKGGPQRIAFDQCGSTRRGRQRNRQHAKRDKRTAA